MSALNHLKVDVPSLSPLGSIYVYDPLIISPSDAVPTIETDKALGAVATPVIGIAIVTAELSLVPFAFTALTLKLYDNPFVRPVTVVEVFVEVPSLKVDQLTFAVGLYSII